MPSMWLHSNRLSLEGLKMWKWSWFEYDQVPPKIESLEETKISNEEIFNEYDEDCDDNTYESDESNNDDGSDYDDFWFKNHLEDLIISYSMTLYFLLLFTRFFIMIEWFSKNLRVRKNFRTIHSFFNHE